MSESPVQSAPSSIDNNSGSLRARRWWLAVLVGAIITLPFAWLLSHAAMLPFFLGLFFFALFGLVIGALMHRIAAPARPFGRLTVLAGTTVVVLLGWGVSIVQEARDVPRKMAATAGQRVRSIGDRTLAEFEAAVAEGVRAHIRERYPPGGTLGYVRWVLAEGVLPKGSLDVVDVPLRATQMHGWWAVRVVLAIALFAFGVGSQTLPLRLAVEPSPRTLGAGRVAPEGASRAP